MSQKDNILYREKYSYPSLRETFRCYYLELPDCSLIKQIGISSGLKGLIRKIAWMSCLEILPTPVTPVWGDIIKVMRDRYDIYLRNELETKFDGVIDNDIDRLYSDIEFFQQEEVRASIKRICKVFALQHPNVGYQQGIHELAGIIFYAYSEYFPVEGETIIPFPEKFEPTFSILTKNGYTEHDTYITLEHLIEFMERSYLNGALGVQDQCNELFDVLKSYNINIYNRFTELGIIPTTFGVRWLRVLFSREYDLDNVLILWDGIFCYGKGLLLSRSIFMVLMLDASREDDSNVLMKLMKTPTSGFSDVNVLIRRSIQFIKDYGYFFKNFF